jgi:hypothetical protein
MKLKPFMDSFKRTLAIMYIDLLRSKLEPTSKDRFDKEMLEWRNKQARTSFKKEVAKQHQLLHLMCPKLGTVLPYELAAANVLNRMASNAEMTQPQAHSWACNEVGLDTGDWSKKLAGSTGLGKRVRTSMKTAKITLQNIR